jgi:hypothetical protein
MTPFQHKGYALIIVCANMFNVWGFPDHEIAQLNMSLEEGPAPAHGHRMIITSSRSDTVSNKPVLKRHGLICQC